MHYAFAMKLEHDTATSDVSYDLDDPGLIVTVPAPTEDIEPDEPDAIILDEFTPALSFRDAKERATGRWEQWYVTQLLRHTGGNLSEAARVARSDRGYLRKLVRKHST